MSRDEETQRSNNTINTQGQEIRTDGVGLSNCRTARGCVVCVCFHVKQTCQLHLYGHVIVECDLDNTALLHQYLKLGSRLLSKKHYVYYNHDAVESQGTCLMKTKHIMLISCTIY